MGALEANQIVEMWKLKQCTVYNDQERRLPRVKGNPRAAVRLGPHRFLCINIRKHNHPLHHPLSRCWTSCLHRSPPSALKSQSALEAAADGRSEGELVVVVLTGCTRCRAFLWLIAGKITTGLSSNVKPLNQAMKCCWHLRNTDSRRLKLRRSLFDLLC